MRKQNLLLSFSTLLLFHSTIVAQSGKAGKEQPPKPKMVLIPSTKFLFKSFVDCNMAEAWIGDTLRIFPGKYGEDPVWGDARDLKFADGRNADEVFLRRREEFREPQMPKNAPVGQPGLHGAVWFETVYQDDRDTTGKTLYAIYHNENYPAILPYDAKTGQGYINHNWPEGLTGPQSPAAVPRIGVMKSGNGGHSWENRGLFIEDLQPRMVLKPHNNSKTFAGGVGDPSAVRSGNYLYLFYGEYSYPEQYDSATYNPTKEWSGQCISVARIAITDLDKPEGKARRWNGKGFDAPWNGAGKPIAALQVPRSRGGGPASVVNQQFHWGPSVSWNEYLNCWVMLMGKVESEKWQGDEVYVSYNFNKDLGAGNASQQWTQPELVLQKPGHVVWYPSLQPLNTPEDIAKKRTCMRLGQRARLFYKISDTGEYVSEYEVEFRKE